MPKLLKAFEVVVLDNAITSRFCCSLMILTTISNLICFFHFYKDMYITLQYKSILAEGLTEIFCLLSLYSSALITRLKGVVQQFDTAPS